jgi:putative FmdB family regulatory protein
MPIYEYYCPRCHVRFSALQKYDAPPKPCPQCKSADVQKLIGRVAVLHNEGDHRDIHEDKRGDIDTEDRREVAKLIKEEGGRMPFSDSPLLQSEAYHEMLDRMAKGYTDDADLVDLEQDVLDQTDYPMAPEGDPGKDHYTGLITVEDLGDCENDTEDDLDENGIYDYKNRQHHEQGTHGHDRPESKRSAANIGWAK